VPLNNMWMDSPQLLTDVPGVNKQIIWIESPQNGQNRPDHPTSGQVH
jgi:hypothetical protein